MALETLIHACVRFTSDAGRDHLEVHHVVAGRCLMALGTVHRARRWVTELGNCPLVGRVALGAILTEQLEVAIVVRVASRAVQGRFAGRDVRVRRGGAIGPGDKLLVECLVLAVVGVGIELA